VSISSPQSGATVSGTVSVSVVASASTTLSSVQLFLDGVSVGPAVTAAPYSISWKTTSTTNGAHTLVAVATDASGDVADSTAVAITVNNASGNQPSISITSPATNSTVSGSVTVAASVSPSSGISYVQFTVDGVAISSQLTAPPYSVAWSATGAAAGSHIIGAIVHSTSGQSASTSETVLIAGNSSCGQGWCNTFPVSGVITGHLKPPFGSSAWNKLNYIPDVGRFYIYTSDGIYTFANSWWSYGATGNVATTNPWVEETTSGTVGRTVTDNTKGFLNSALGSKDTTITLQSGQGSTFHPDPVHGGVLVIDNEEIGYSESNLSDDTFTGVVRGIRGTTAASHTAGARVNGGAPFPQSRIAGALVPVTDHIPDRHPFLFSSYDTRRSQLFQVTGIVELNKLEDIWYLCMQQNAYCSESDVKVWRPLVTPTQLPGKADGAMAYDSDDDVMILYGGQSSGSPTADTWLLCFQSDPQISGNSVGCPAGRPYPDWVKVGTSPANGAGLRYFHTLVYDSYYHKAILFGGNDGSDTDPNTTWVYTPATRSWVNANPSGKIPAAFRRPAMTYDSTRHVSVLYEGPLGVVTDGIPGGLYLYDAGANQWTLTSVTGGPVPTTDSTSPVSHGRLSLGYDPQTDTFMATELGASNYVLYAWELPGTSIK